MFECSFSREPVDLRLLWLRIRKRIWLIPLSMIIGAVCVALLYFCYKTVITGRTYLVENIYYIDFAEDSSGKQYDWVNQYTWSTLADMDIFIDGIYDELGGAVSREEIRSYSDCTVESDGRYLYMRCTTPDPELSMRVSKAYEKTLFAFCDAHKEFNSIVCEHSGDAVENSNIRLLEVSILGACLGLAIILVMFVGAEVADSAVYIPATLEKRLHIPSLLAPSMPEFNVNFEHLLKGKNSIAIVYADSDPVNITIPGDIKTESFVCPVLNPDLLTKISGYEGVLLVIKAKKRNGEMVERTVEACSRLGITIDATVLSGEDADFIKKYYRL